MTSGIQSAQPNCGPATVTSLQAPLIPSVVVERDRLIERLDLAARKKLIVLNAPMGYGKSVLLAQWAAVKTWPDIAWMTMPPGLDANQFARDLCLALESVDGRSRSEIVSRAEVGGRRVGAGFMSALLTDAESMPPTVLILDDFHNIENAHLLADIAFLLANSPTQLHFVISTRADIALPYHRLRSGDQLTELRKQDLAFDRRQARELTVRISDRELTENQHEQLWSQTEGWAAGIVFAAQAIRNSTDSERVINAFKMGDWDTGEDLVEQVLSHRRPEVQRFLLQTSVLEEMNASLCNAVTQQSNGEELLDELSSGAFFITPIDEWRTWFRYHHLFRPLLLRRASQTRGINERVLLERAADWYFQHDDLDNGVHYLILAEAWHRVVDAICEHSVAVYLRGRIAAAVRWFEALPDSVAVEVCLLHAALLALSDDVAASDSMLQDLDIKLSTAGERVVADFFYTWSVQSRSTTAETIDRANRCLTGTYSVNPADIPDVLGLTALPLMRTAAVLNRGIAEMYEGQYSTALNSVADIRTGSGFSALDEAVLGQRALLDAWMGRLQSAHLHGARALAYAEKAGLETHSSTIAANLALAYVARMRGQLNHASDLLDATTQRLQQSQSSSQIAICAAERTFLATAQGEIDRGFEELAEYHSRSLAGPPPAVASRLVAAEVGLFMAAGDIAGAEHLLDDILVQTPEIVSAAIRISVAKRDLPRARKILVRGAFVSTELHLEHLLWECVLDDLDGNTDHAREAIKAVVVRARREGNERVFADAGYHAMRLLRWLYVEEPSSFVRRLIDSPMSVSTLR